MLFFKKVVKCIGQLWSFIKFGSGAKKCYYGLGSDVLKTKSKTVDAQGYFERRYTRRSTEKDADIMKMANRYFQSKLRYVKRNNARLPWNKNTKYYVNPDDEEYQNFSAPFFTLHEEAARIRDSINCLCKSLMSSDDDLHKNCGIIRLLIAQIQRKFTIASDLLVVSLDDIAIYIFTKLHEIASEHQIKLRDWPNMKPWHKLCIYWAAIHFKREHYHPVVYFDEFYFSAYISRRRVCGCCKCQDIKLKNLKAMWHVLNAEAQLAFKLQSFGTAAKTALLNESKVQPVLTVLEVPSSE